MFLENDLPFCYKPNFDIIFKTKSSINTNDDVSRISRLDAPDLGDLENLKDENKESKEIGVGQSQILR